jgi:two-component system sensor histidine kinase RegB
MTEKSMSSQSARQTTQTAATAADLAPNLALPWVFRLRYGMVAGEAAIILGMAYGFRLEFPVMWTLAPVAIVLLSNILLSRLKSIPFRFPQETLGAVLCLDTLCLTAVLGLTGGPMNPFSLIYLVLITLSAVVLRKVWTRALSVLSAFCFGLLFFFHAESVIFSIHHVDQGLSPHLVGMWVAFLIAAGLTTFFTGKISDALRTREQEVLTLQDQVAKSERLASLVTLAAGAAHELGTPLATIAVVARELERYAAEFGNNTAVLEDARLIRSEVDRCRRILEQMSVQSAEPMGEIPAALAIEKLATSVVAQFSETKRKLLHVVLLEESMTAILPVKATIQSLTALIQNALDANIENRPIILEFSTTQSAIQIQVRDRGHGIPAAVLRRISEPFFTTKEPGKGMGLGTFLVRTFAERLGGELLFQSSAESGTTATIKLPLLLPTARNASVTTDLSHAAV